MIVHIIIPFTIQSHRNCIPEILIRHRGPDSDLFRKPAQFRKRLPVNFRQKLIPEKIAGFSIRRTLPLFAPLPELFLIEHPDKPAADLIDGILVQKTDQRDGRIILPCQTGIFVFMRQKFPGELLKIFHGVFIDERHHFELVSGEGLFRITGDLPFLNLPHGIEIQRHINSPLLRRRNKIIHPVQRPLPELQRSSVLRLGENMVKMMKPDKVVTDRCELVHHPVRKFMLHHADPET